MDLSTLMNLDSLKGYKLGNNYLVCQGFYLTPTQKSRVDANVLVQTRCLKGYNVRHYPDPIPKVVSVVLR